jgi:hypothetical protein
MPKLVRLVCWGWLVSLTVSAASTACAAKDSPAVLPMETTSTTKPDAKTETQGKAKPARLVHEEWEYRYDPSLISEAELKALLDFSEHSQAFHRDSGGRTPSLNARKSAAAGGGWRAWDTWGPEWVRQSRDYLDSERTRVSAFKNRKVPIELEPARNFLVDDALRDLELERALVDVVEKNDAASLANRTLPGLPPGDACATAVKAVEGESTREGKLKRDRFDWHRCVANSSRTYPKSAWAAFLKRYGITERHDSSTGE